MAIKAGSAGEAQSARLRGERAYYAESGLASADSREESKAA